MWEDKGNMITYAEWCLVGAQGKAVAIITITPLTSGEMIPVCGEVTALSPVFTPCWRETEHVQVLCRPRLFKP